MPASHPSSRAVVPYLVEEVRRGSVRRLTLPAGPVTLTPREWEVGELLREGHPTTKSQTAWASRP